MTRSPAHISWGQEQDAKKSRGAIIMTIGVLHRTKMQSHSKFHEHLALTKTLCLSLFIILLLSPEIGIIPCSFHFLSFPNQTPKFLWGKKRVQCPLPTLLPTHQPSSALMSKPRLLHTQYLPTRLTWEAQQ